MHGNVWEWVQDCYDEYSKAPSDGSAAPDTDKCTRVLRGGSWIIVPRILRSAQRFRLVPGIRNYDLGFRVARSLSPART